MASPKQISWLYAPLLDTRDEKADDRVVIDGTLTLFSSGDVVIHNRWFRCNYLGLFGSDAIDFAFPGGHAYRDRHSNRLVVRTGGPVPQTLVFEYQRILFIFAGVWYQVIPRVS